MRMTRGTKETSVSKWFMEGDYSDWVGQQATYGGTDSFMKWM